MRTEYKSKYKGHDPKLVQGSTSPILKPRNKNEPEPAAHPTERTRPEAGLLSTEVHVTKEPPLQHKRIVPYERNHNILTTETTKQFLENGDDTDKKKNPILAYDAKLQKLKKDKQDKVKQRVRMPNQNINYQKK